LRVAFAGTPEFAATVLRGLIPSEHAFGLVVSQPDARRGRGRRLKPPPVAALARERGMPLLQPDRISEANDEISACDALVVAAYGQILCPETLSAAPRGAWNVHASLLPRYRGAAPVERAIMAGESETGVTIIRMDEGLDTGDVALEKRIPIPPDMTGGELTEALARAGAEAIVEALDLLERDELSLTPQDHARATYAAKLGPEDLPVDWTLPAGRVHDHIRALAPRPGARASHPDYDGPIKLLRSRLPHPPPQLEPGEIQAREGRILVGCGSGAVEILDLQLPGKKALSAADLLRGNRFEGRLDIEVQDSGP
jgi:methionyl-tRNA formyltransferase